MGVLFQIDDADTQLIAEAITSETATITVERADGGTRREGSSGRRARPAERTRQASKWVRRSRSVQPSSETNRRRVSFRSPLAGDGPQ